MEIILCAIASACVWAVSLTILLPYVLLLKMSESFSRLNFAVIYKILLRKTGDLLLKYRKRTFDKLKDHLRRKDTSTPLEVLEFGFGPNQNLQFYPENCHLTAIEPNPNFLNGKQNEILKKYPGVRRVRILKGVAEDLSSVGDSSVDVVVGTLVLCSVQDLDKSLSEVRRVLKPGGVYVFLEHVAYPPGDFRSWVQKSLAPLWRTFFHNCSIDLCSRKYIDRAGFSKVLLEVTNHPDLFIMGFFLGPHLIGIAVK